MDKATILGFIIGCGAVVAAICHEGTLTAFIDIPGMMVCFGGSLGSALVGFPLKSILTLPGTLMHCFKVKVPNANEEIARFNDYATIVRREGLLGLEAKLAEVRDPFLKRGLEMVIDNAPKEKVGEVLEIEIQRLHERHGTGKKIFENMGAMAPAFGMVGTLIGLIQMLGSLDDPSKIGSGMAVAMVTTSPPPVIGISPTMVRCFRGEPPSPPPLGAPGCMGDGGTEGDDPCGGIAPCPVICGAGAGAAPAFAAA